MKQTQKTKKLYQTVKCSFVMLKETDLLTASVEPLADEVKFDKDWLK
ncbi:MAG: hypothetical protein IJ506_02015 [Clostridia bacterium]|nr:hypothetical protein [Clostridia bacterium]